MKKLIVMLMSVFLLIHVVAIPSASASTKISIFVKDKLQPYSTLATLENGNTLVPLRGIFESLNAKVTWNAKTQTIDASKGTQKIWLKIGSKTAKINNKTITLAAAPKIVKGSTLVPLRFVSEALGEKVTWDNGTRSIVIGQSTLLNGLFASTANDIKAFELSKLHYDVTEETVRTLAYNSKQFRLPARIHYIFENQKLIRIHHNFLSEQEVYYGWNAMLQLFAEINEQVEKVYGKATLHDRDDNRIMSEWTVGKYSVILQVDDYELMTSAYLVIYLTE